MEVTNGLISCLVKSKSTERVLAPIASQVSLLMILNEVQGEESADESTLNLSACLERVIQAVDGFIRVGQDHVHKSSDHLFDSQMNAACESLELAKSELYVAGQQLTSGISTNSLVSAAKDVLQTVLRVLVVVDDFEVRRCVRAVAVVEANAKRVANINEIHDMVPVFKVLTEALLYMTMLVSRRQKDLVSTVQRDELMTGLNLLHKGVPSLRMALQTFLKYPKNPQALAGKQQVLDQILSVLTNIRTTLESGPPSSLEVEEMGHFVQHIDKVLDGLSEGSRFQLSPDLESWVARIIRHSMEVAHMCQGTYRHLITRTCQKILQSKFRLFELQEAALQSPHLTDIRLDFEGVCEALLDESCEVEKHVNMALLGLIVDTCCFTSQPLEQLAVSAIHVQGAFGSDIGNSALGKEFSYHGDRLCQVAVMASASSMDPKKVRAVKLAASRLEQIHPEVMPVTRAVARQPGNVAAVRQLKSLVQEWEMESNNLVNALDSMTDPVVFLQVTEQRVRQGINVVRGKVSEKDEAGAKAGLRQLLAHTRRMTKVALRVVDGHCDAVFRNGLMVYIQQLEAARRGVKDAGRAALQDMCCARVVDTFYRRLGLLHDAAADLRHGVKGDNHVDLLNPVRQGVRHQHLLSDSLSTGERVAHARQSVQDKQQKSSQATQTMAEFGPKMDKNSVKVISSTTCNQQLISSTTCNQEKVTSSTCDQEKMSSTTAYNQGTSATSITTATKLSSENGSVKAVSAGESGVQNASRNIENNTPAKGIGSNQQTGETAILLSSCRDGLVSAAMSADTVGVAQRSADILSWTAHLGELAINLLDHCTDICRKSEMQQLTEEVDRLAPQLIEAARFVVAGDGDQTDSLQRVADDWIIACDKLRIIVDVAAGEWSLLLKQVWQAVSSQDVQKLKSLLSVFDRNQREMNRLLEQAKTLDGHHMPRGTQIVQFFHESHLELDSLGATLKTAADCITMTGDTTELNRAQLFQRGREWCVLMTCLVKELDFVASALSRTGQASLGVPAITTALSSSIKASARVQKAIPLLQEETLRLKTLLSCLVEEDGEVKQRSEELSQDLADLMTELLQSAQTPVDDSTLPQAQLFARLDAELAQSRWIEKALTAEQLVRSHCIKFSVLINNLSLLATTDSSSLDASVKQPAELEAKMKSLTQRILQAIQISADLSQRTVVRHCLNDLTNLLPVITQAVDRCLSDTDKEKGEIDLQKAGTIWGAKVHRLIASLRSMNDIKPSLVNDIERQLSGQPVDVTAVKPTQPSVRLAVAGTPVPASNVRTPASNTYTSVTKKHTPHSPVLFATAQRKSSPVMATPSPAQLLATPRSRQAKNSCQVVQTTVEMSPYRRSALYTSWLASAQYLREEVAGWEESDNHFVLLVRSMARQCEQMADFARGGTSFMDTDEVAKTGVALATSGQQLEKFARSLLAMTSHLRHASDLKKAAETIATHTRQLLIVASVLQNSPTNPEGDCILARNAANLIEAVRHMFSVAEGVSIAGILQPQEGDQTGEQVVDLLTRWQHKLTAYHNQQTSIAHLDELGLRRIESHNPPSLSALANG